MTRRAPALLAAALWVGLAWTTRARPKQPQSGVAPGWAREAMAREAQGGGDVAWLHEERIVEPLADGGVRITERLAGRVLSEAGRHVLGVHAHVRATADRVERFETWNLHPDGRVLVPHPKDDVGDHPYTSDDSVFEARRLRSAQVPGVVVGSVVASESIVVEDLDRGAEQHLFGDDRRTTATSRFELRVPAGWGFELVTRRADAVSVQRSESGVVAEARELSPLPIADFAPPAAERLPVAWARWWSPDGSRGFQSWDAVAKWYRALAEPVMAVRGEAESVSKRLAPAAPGRMLDAIEQAFAFAANDVRYVSIQVGIGGYRPASPAETCARRWGDCKAKTHLLRALVEPWGLRTFPVFVRAGERVDVLAEVPTPAQFDHQVAAVLLPDGAGADLWPVVDVEGMGRLLILDATARGHGAFELNEAVQGALGLIVLPDSGVLVRLPVQPPEASRFEHVVTASLDEDGRVVAGRLTGQASGSGASRFRHHLAGLDAAGLEDLRERMITEKVPGATVGEHSFRGAEGGPLLEWSLAFSGGRIGRRAADLLIVGGTALDDLVATRLPPPPAEWDLVVGPPREEVLRLEATLPGGWRPEELPAPVTIEAPHVSARCAWSFEDDRLRYERVGRILSLEVPPADYPAFRDAVRELQSSDARGVVFVRTAAGE